MRLFVKSPVRRYILISKAKEQSLKIVVPASTSNLGPGFDTLGLAVNRYLVINAEPASRFSIEVAGEGAAEIPVDETNLTLQAMRKILGNLPDMRLRIENGIPSCGGLGASGAAIAGGLLLANELSGRKLEADEIYNIAVGIEGHPDNVSAALFGGLVVNARGGNGSYSKIRIPVEGRLKMVAVLPDSRIETRTARKILPTSVSLGEAVSNVQHSSLLVAALASGNYDMIGPAMHDELHEKHRKKLIPHYDEFEKAAAASGALSFTISGAGSSCVAFCLGETRKVHEAFAALIGKLGLKWRSEILEPVNRGADVVSD